MLPVTTKDVEARMLQLRGKLVLIDRDVATLYGVETKRIIEAVRNNPDKFLLVTVSPCKRLRLSNWSKISTGSRR